MRRTRRVVRRRRISSPIRRRTNEMIDVTMGLATASFALAGTSSLVKSANNAFS